MLNQFIANMLVENRHHFMIAADMVATVSENNPLSHAFLVLTKVRYAKIPVLDHDSKFKGLISLPMITDTMLGLDHISFQSLDIMTVKDVMQKDVATRDPNIATATYIPAGKVHSQGVELEAHHQITPQLSTIASYTWNRLRFQDTKDGTDNNTPQLTPDQMASFWARYQFPAGISVGAGVRYIGKQWADDANTARLPSVTLMDAMMRADLGVWSPTLKGAYVQVNANNIGDREYISGCYGTGNCYWGAERSVIATVGYDF